VLYHAGCNFWAADSPAAPASLPAKKEFNRSKTEVTEKKKSDSTLCWGYSSLFFALPHVQARRSHSVAGRGD
jgi:hypothetical protein